jgi:hypothetical protein
MIAKDRIDHNFTYTTGNPDVIYAFAWLDLKKEGPMVLDMPPRLQGLLDDMWHRPITDIGAAGPDKNEAESTLLLPTTIMALFRMVTLSLDHRHTVSLSFCVPF